MFRVYVDASTSDAGGMGTFVESLIPALVNMNPSWDFSGIVPDSVAQKTQSVRWSSTFANASRIDKIRMQQGLVRDGGKDVGLADVGISLGPIAPLLHRKTPWIEVVHDWRHIVSPLEFDIWTRAYRATLYPLSIRRCQGLVYVSESSWRQTNRYFKKSLKDRREVVIRHGVDHVPDNSGTPKGDRVLAYGHWSNKRPELAIEVWANAWRCGVPESWRLEVVGLSEENRRLLRRLCGELGVQSSVDLYGYLTDAEFNQVRTGASIQLVTSNYEGFGLPVLEGLSLGQFVIATAGVGMEEAGGEAAVFQDWTDGLQAGQTLADAINNSELRQARVECGKNFAAGHTWLRSAAKYSKFIEEIAKIGSR